MKGTDTILLETKNIIINRGVEIDQRTIDAKGNQQRTSTPTSRKKQWPKSFPMLMNMGMSCFGTDSSGLAKLNVRQLERISIHFNKKLTRKFKKFLALQKKRTCKG